jgi:hypothetical protein
MAMLFEGARCPGEQKSAAKGSSMNSIGTAGVAYQRQASTVAFTEPPISAPVSRPFASVPAQAPVPVAAPVAPVAPVAQAAPPAAYPPQPVQAVQAPTPAVLTDESIAVFIRLSSGERIWAGRFDSATIAEQRAADIVRALNRPEPGVWAKFGNRLIRPDAVVSIELAPRREE